MCADPRTPTGKSNAVTAFGYQVFTTANAVQRFTGGAGAAGELLDLSMLALDGPLSFESPWERYP